MIIFCFLFVSSCGAEETAPFINHTAEECVIDEACVWDAFSRIAFGDEFSNSNELQYISKWDRPVVIGLMGKNKKNLNPW